LDFGLYGLKNTTYYPYDAMGTKTGKSSADASELLTDWVDKVKECIVTESDNRECKTAEVHQNEDPFYPDKQK
jgi:hypothetical protein